MIFRPYHGYMDETGTHDQSDIVAVVGYLATYDQWTRFEIEFYQVMRHYCVGDFHMTDFESRRGEFDWTNYWWDNETRIRLIERITTLCQQNTIIGLGCAVVREHYEQLFSPQIQDDLRHPYYFCLYACLNMLIHWNDIGRLDVIKPVNFLFDHKPGRFRLGSARVSWQSFATELYQRVKSGLDAEGKTLGEITFGRRQDYPQLRAADVIAYEVAREARRLWKDSTRPISKALDVLRKDMNLLVTFPDEKRMRNFVRIIEAATEALNRGASEEEQEQIIRELRAKLEP